MPYLNTQRGTWTGQVVHGKRRYRKQYGSRKEAERWEREKREELRRRPLRTPTISLLEFANRYLDYSSAKHSPKTYAEKRLTFRFLFRSVSSSLPVSALHRGDVLTHLARQSRGRSGNAANKDRKNLISAWNWAVRYLPGFPERNPFCVDRFPEERSVRYVPPEKDFWKVYDAAGSEKDRVMLLCCLHLAARKREVFGLRTEDADLHLRRVRLATRKRKDGSLEHDLLPMTDRLFSELSAYIPKVSGEWLFPDPRTGGPYRDRPGWTAGLCRKAGVREFGLHGIRHLAASILIGGGASLIDVQALLRHRNITTTERYVHRLENLRNALKVFG